MNVNKISLQDKTIVFYDTEGDKKLPFSPTETLKNTLSDKNFFYVFFPNLADKINYDGKGEIEVKSRWFLGY